MNNRNSFFYYEHMGHMQFTALTLRTFQVLNQWTGGAPGVFVPWDQIRQNITGFSDRLIEGELDRFCYGFEAMDRVNQRGDREIALTEVGISFLTNLIGDAPYQASQLAILLRPARRRRHYNVIVQESTFFNPEMYEVIRRFGFRQGSARDFLRCLGLDDLRSFVLAACDALSPAPDSPASSLEQCLVAVQTQGKFWPAGGGHYAWFVFPQSFKFDADDWIFYDRLVRTMVRPTEWGGGGRDLTGGDTLAILENEERLHRFRDQGIIRPLLQTANRLPGAYRLTSPGYLMWERKTLGFLFEFRLRKLSEGCIEIALCDAADLPEISLSDVWVSHQIPSLRMYADQIDQVYHLLERQLQPGLDQ